jgi:hypothetical protein
MPNRNHKREITGLVYNPVPEVPILMSSRGNLVHHLSDARYPGISRMSKEPPLLSAGQDCCILNSIDTFHSSLTYFSYVEMIAEPIVP